MRLAAAAALLCSCLSDPGGLCARDSDCSGGASGSFCAEGICQGPPHGTIAVPSRAFSRSEILLVSIRVDRSHGAATGRVVFGGLAIEARAVAGGALQAEVPLSLAPAGAEGAVPFSVELRDDLGHVTALPGSVVVDDRPPRIAVDAATVPAAAVLRGTQLSLRVTVEDLGAVTVAGATRSADGSFALPVDTRTAPPGVTTFDVAVTATDAVGNVSVAHALVPVTRLKYAVREPSSNSVNAIVVSDALIWAEVNHSDFWILNRADGAQVARAPAGGTPFSEIATDGTRLFFARSDNMVCRMGADGNIQVCRGPYATVTHGPILQQDKTAIFATSGPAASLTANRLYAWIDNPAGDVAGTRPVADFAETSPAIAPDGVIYAGASQAVVAAKFDGIALDHKPTPESPNYIGEPAFRKDGSVLLSTGVAAALNTFTFADPLNNSPPPPIATQVATLGITISSPTIAADGTALLTTSDRHLIALRPDSTIRWTVSLPEKATAPPSHGAGDLLYIGTLSGDILALSLSDGSTVWSYSAGSPIRGPLAPGCDGVLYAATDGAVLALVIDQKGLADSPWPKSAHDVRGTGDARRPLRSPAGGCLE